MSASKVKGSNKYSKIFWKTKLYYTKFKRKGTCYTQYNEGTPNELVTCHI